MRGIRFAAALVAATVAQAAPAAHADVSLKSGPLTLTASQDPWRLSLTDPRGPPLTESAAAGLGAHTAAGWTHAMKATMLHSDGDRIEADVTMDAGAALHVTITAPASGVIRIVAVPASGQPDAMRMGFGAVPGERYFGFGSRSDVVDHRGKDVENYVADGPSRPEDRQSPRALVPPWASGDRDDSTYYPVPWLVSSRGYGALIDRDEPSRFHLGTDPADAWVAEVDAPKLALRIFGGPTDPAALRRLEAA